VCGVLEYRLKPQRIGSRFKVEEIKRFPVQCSGLKNVKPSPVRDFKQL
jgi:hypothetical protein